MGFKNKIGFSVICLLLISTLYYAQEKKYSIHYYLEILDISQKTARVTITVKNYPDRQPRFQFYPYMGGEEVQLGNIQAFSDSGKSLSVKQEGSFYYLEKGSRNLKVIYNIQLGQMKKNPKGPLGNLTESYLLTQSAWVFLLPVDGIPENLKADVYSASFKIPEGWEMITPWEKIGSDYIETDFYRFYQATFGAGRFEVKTENIQGTNVKIALDSKFGQEQINRMYPKLFQIFQEAKNIFKTNDPSNHLSILVKASGPGEWQNTNENCYSQGEAIEQEKSAYYQFSHRVFHTFNAFYPNGMFLEDAWIREGSDEYFNTVCLFKIKAEKPLVRLRNTYEDYLKLKNKYPEGLNTPSEKLAFFEKQWFVLYQKGQLFFALLDYEIRKRTNNKKNVFDIYSNLYPIYGKYQKPKVSGDTFIQAASQVAETDLKGFFKKYGNLHSHFEISPLIQDSDSDGICDLAEMILGTDPGKQDSDGDGYSDYAEFIEGTDPLNHKSFPGRLVIIDGIDLESQKISVKTIYQNQDKSEACSEKISKITYALLGEFAYFQILTQCKPSHDKNIRYYINIDTDFDQIGDRHVGTSGIYGGDTLKFRKDWSTYDAQAESDVDGLESFIGEIVEIKMPLRLIGHKKNFNISVGVWDVKKNKAVDSIKGWIEVK